MAAKSRTHDVVIAGGGIVGQCLAMALRSAEGAGLSVGLVAPDTPPPHRPRAYAIAAGPRRLLEILGVWQTVAAEAEPVRAMHITDSRLEEMFRPVLLSFEGDAEPGEPFAHIVPENALAAACAAAFARSKVKWHKDTVTRFEDLGASAEAIGSAANYGARLVVAADGGRSTLRSAAGIRTVGWDYRQAGIVAMIGHEVPHDGVATQHFLPGGPLALLPLPDDADGRHRSSIVWTVPNADADRLMALDPITFAGTLSGHTGPDRGEIEVLDGPARFPLGLMLARRYAVSRLALVGDAAHRVHPIAGQGLNLGLKDVAALAEIVVDAVRLGIDPGSLATLERYERWRRFDAVQLAVATDGLNRLFRIDNVILRGMRDLGLGLVERAEPLKRLFIREAAGDLGNAPRLIAGRPL